MWLANNNPQLVRTLFREPFRNSEQHQPIQSINDTVRFSPTKRTELIIILLAHIWSFLSPSAYNETLNVTNLFSSDQQSVTPSLKGNWRVEGQKGRMAYLVYQALKVLTILSANLLRFQPNLKKMLSAKWSPTSIFTKTTKKFSLSLGKPAEEQRIARSSFPPASRHYDLCSCSCVPHIHSPLQADQSEYTISNKGFWWYKQRD